MLQNIRDNSQGWIAKTIIGVIVALHVDSLAELNLGDFFTEIGRAHV